MKKKLKIFIIIFICTFALGGFNITSAYTTTRNLAGLKADFLGEPHYTPDVIGRNGAAKQDGIEKIKNNEQLASVVTKDGRTIAVSVSDEKGNILTDVWNTVSGTTNGYIRFKGASSLMSGATNVSNIKFAFAAKLVAPWTQAEISSGTWVIDQ